MNDIQRGVVTLLRSAVTGEKLNLPEGFSMEDALPLIKKHHMLTLAYAGAVNCGISTKDATMQQLFQSYLKKMLVSERQMRDVNRIFAAFDENGIDYMPLKGCKMKALYPKPELRIMGDADILIRTEQYDRIRSIMKDLGFTEGEESNHELIWKSDSLYLELHKRLIPSYNKDYYAYFGDGWQLGVIERGTRYTMEPEDEWVYLFTHFAKHYRDGGIGCRHVVDLWVWLRNHPDLNWNAIEANLTKLQLLEFCGNIRRLLRVWFEGEAGDPVTDFISQFLFDSGSWGRKDTRILSAYVKKSKGGLVLDFFRTVFPSADYLSVPFPVLKKHRWLLPGVWVVRWFQIILFRRSSFRIRHQEMQYATKDKVSARQQALNYVGLDFHFE